MSLSGQFLRFCLVGVVNTALNLGAYWTFLGWTGAHYLVAGAIGFLSGAVSGFFLNRAWTFRRPDLPVGLGLTAYLAVQIFSLGGHSAAQWAAHQAGVPVAWSQFCGIGVSTFINFGLSRLFVFGRPAVGA